jgi:hypothetical protein
MTWFFGFGRRTDRAKMEEQTTANAKYRDLSTALLTMKP